MIARRIPGWLGTLATLLSLTAWAAPAAAAPQVVVTVPPLYSLVESLMEGVGKPELLYDRPEDLESDRLGATQTLELVTADMVVWVGPELERSLATALEGMPHARAKSLMVGHHLPLLEATAGSRWTHAATQHGMAHDPQFWLDPRLAVMAVRHITPQLVKMDPDNCDTYLDNEIRLVGQLRKLEQDLQTRLAPLQGRAVALAPDAPRYLAWRFGLIDARLDSTAANADVAVLELDALGYGAVRDGGSYFTLMERNLNTLLATLEPEATPLVRTASRMKTAPAL